MDADKWYKRFLFWEKSAESKKKNVEALRTEFKSRYNSFKQLLTANNQVLETMSELEEVLANPRPIGMNFVQSRSTRIATNVFRIINYMNDIAPGRYEDLVPRFKAIQSAMVPYLTHHPATGDEPLAVPLDSLTRADTSLVGGKMASLGEIKKRLELNTPDGFVMTARAYWEFMDYNRLRGHIQDLVQSADTGRMSRVYDLSTRLQKLILEAELPPHVISEIEKQYRLLEEKNGAGVVVAMRSSALFEDHPGLSFAGQYRTVFNVTGDNIVHAYRQVVASKYRVQAMMYRLNNGIRDDQIAMCVGCMPVVDAIAGGVAYSRNPLLSRDDSVTIHSVWGLPKPVVDGTVASDHFTVSRQEPLKITRGKVAEKVEQFVYSKEKGACHTVPLDKKRQRVASLTNKQALEIARIVLRIEQTYQAAKDVEWAVDQDGSIVILQSRALKQVEARDGTGDGLVDKTKQIESHATSSVIMSGTMTACPGAGSGPVYIVRKEADALEFPQGAVLVAAQALPYWATLLGLASAVVTEQGSIAGHLASVAREFQVPMLLGAEGATEKLKSNDIVTVNASTKRIYQGRLESVLSETKPVAQIEIDDSPVYEALRGVSPYVTHLNLLDPEAATFRAKSCRSLHDIIRFCHEKSVGEMFQFGTKHKFPERSSRQLLCDVPMQFWIIDLDDGFKSETKSPKYIRLEEIASVPMMAIWRGMMEIEWEGPPPMDARGFMGVLMESVVDPALNPSMPSAYSARNYFMISKNFCSLHSRFGYHFSTVEALVGERERENYIAFQFKGGAASLERKVRRARLVAEIIEQAGFRVELKQDSVRGRLEGYGRGSMESHLEILGYLIFHTRQLDMVMTNDASIEFYKQKTLEGMKQLSKA
jgi:pyruvate,water dikinase